MKTLLKKLGSRKFLVGVGAAVAVGLGVPQEIIIPLVAYLLGEAAVDAVAALRVSK